jgi:hypothetical protein
VSDTDAYCDAARAAALVDAVLAVSDRCAELAEGGVDAGLIEEHDFSPVLRAKEDADSPEEVRALADKMLARLDALTHPDAAAEARPDSGPTSGPEPGPASAPEPGTASGSGEAGHD